MYVLKYSMKKSHLALISGIPLSTTSLQVRHLSKHTKGAPPSEVEYGGAMYPYKENSNTLELLPGMIGFKFEE